MINNCSVLALIPARGGSKGLPGKNTRLLNGKPLIAWTIDHAIRSKYLDDILVSTDCEKIADISKQYGANVPFLRPEELATDDAKAIDVIMHAIDYTGRQGRLYDLVMYLQPTSPLREPKDIDSAIESLFLFNAQVVVGVCESEYPSYAMNTLPPDRCMKNFLKPELVNKNRQDLPKDYRINGAIYLAYSDYLKLERTLFGENTYAYIMPRERSIDIDTELDFRFAECILNSK